MAFKIFRKNCCGLDVHKTWIYACIGITDINGRTEYKQSRFSAFTRGLQDLADWFAKYGCTEVCMESAGKYWIPVFNVLEKSFEDMKRMLDGILHLYDVGRSHIKMGDLLTIKDQARERLNAINNSDSEAP